MVALTQTLVDDFNDGTIGPAWDNWGSLTESGGTFNVSLSTAEYRGCDYTYTNYDGKYAGFQVIDSGTPSTAGVYVYPILLYVDGSNTAYFTIESATVRISVQVAGTNTEHVSFPYDSAVHKWFAIGFIDGKLSFVWSTDGANWTEAFSMANPFVTTVAIIEPMIGTDVAPSPAVTASWDNFSTWVPAPRTAVDLTDIASSPWVFGTTSVTPAYPTGVAIGDCVYLIVQNRPNGNTPATPAGFTLVGTQNGGGGTQAAGTGQTRITIFKRVADSALTGTVSVTGLGNAGMATMVKFRGSADASMTFTESWSFISKATAAANLNGTTSAAVSLATKDQLLITASMPDDEPATSTFTSVTSTGSTISAPTAQVAHAITANGNDLSGNVYRSTVTAGSSNVVVTTAGTLATSETSLVIVLRIRGSILATTTQNFALPLVTDSYTLFGLSGQKNYSLASASDSHVVNALAGAKRLSLLNIADAHSVFGMTAQKRAGLSNVASSDTPNAAKAVKTNALANVTETHTLNSLTRTIGAVLALITGPGTPNGLATQKRNGLGSVTVSEVLNVLRLGRGYNLPSVTDGASLSSLTGRKAATLGLVSDGATFSNLAGKKLYPLGQIIDTSGTVQPLTDTDSFYLGQTPVELAELFPLTVQKRCSISTLTDTTTITAPVRSKRATLGTITSTADVNPLGYGGTFTLGLITSSDTLFSPSTSTVRHLELIESGSDLFVPTLEFDVLYAQLFGSVTQEHLVSANVATENNSSVVLTQKNELVRADISVATIDGSVETLMLFADAAAVVSKGGTVVTDTIHGEARNA